MTARRISPDTRTDPRIVFFVPLPNESKGRTGAVLGSQIVIDTIKDNCDVQVVEMKHRVIRDSAPGGDRAKMPFVNRGMSRLPKLVTDHLHSLKELRAQLRKEPDRRVTIYLVANSSPGGSLRDLFTMIAIRQVRADAGFVLHSRNGNFFYPTSAVIRRVRRWMFARAETVIALSKRLIPEEAQLRALGLDPPRQLRIVPNTIDAAMVPSAAEIAATRGRSGPIRVLYLSNFIPSKGYELLGEAARILEKRGLAERFRFVFRGKWLSDESRAAFIASFPKHLIDAGLVDVGGAIWERAETRAELLASDIFALPTRYPAEAMPRSILEAMAARSAIIATDHAACADMVNDGENGLINAGLDPHGIADFLEHTPRAAIDAMGDASLARFQKDFARDTHERRLRAIFQCAS